MKGDILKHYNYLSKRDIKKGEILLKDKLDNFISFLNGKDILDVGCGSGHDTNYFRKKKYNCLGIDISGNMIGYAKNKYGSYFREYDMFKLPFKDKRFDGLWCSSVLMHVDKKDINKLFAKFYKSLKPGGVFGLIVSKKKEGQNYTFC